MKAVTTGQVGEVMARVAQIKWADIDGEELQKFVNLPPREASEMLARLVSGEYQLTEAVKKCTKYLGKVQIYFTDGLFEELVCNHTVIKDALFTNKDVVRIFGAELVKPKRKSITLRKYSLIKNTSDLQIISEVGQGIWFKGRKDLALLLYIIASMISKQWDGGEGELLNNGLVNSFYYEEENGEQFFIGVKWNHIGRRWGMVVWAFSRIGWGAESVVFSRN